MRIALFFPPVWNIFSTTYLALPLLAGFLRKKGISVQQRDVNIEVANILLSRQYLKESLEKLHQTPSFYNTVTTTEEAKIDRRFCEEFGNDILEKIDSAKSVLRRIGAKPEEVIQARNIVEHAAAAIGLSYCESKWSLLSSSRHSMRSSHWNRSVRPLFQTLL
jgi:hypothetical protein